MSADYLTLERRFTFHVVGIYLHLLCAISKINICLNVFLFRQTPSVGGTSFWSRLSRMAEP